MVYKMTVENFVRIAWTVFEKIEKSQKMAVFGLILAIFGQFWLCFSHSSHTILMPLSTQGLLLV